MRLHRIRVVLSVTSTRERVHRKSTSSSFCYFDKKHAHEQAVHMLNSPTSPYTEKRVIAMLAWQKTEYVIEACHTFLHAGWRRERDTCEEQRVY